MDLILKYLHPLKPRVSGLCGKVFYRVVSVGRCQKLPPCLTKAMPAGSKTDPLLPKSKPNSPGISVSGVTDFRRGKKTSPAKHQLQPEKGGRLYEKDKPYRQQGQ